MEGTIAHRKGSATALTLEGFERLLSWLDLDREAAGELYEEIRYQLVGRFRAHGCSTPEDLADETINRVATKLTEIAPTYVGDRRPYFYRVAHYVHLEYRRKRVDLVELPKDLSANHSSEEVESEFECLEQCLDTLPQQNREIIVTYYQGERRKKIELRKQLAVGLNIELPILRLKAQRIREKLKHCILDCLESGGKLNNSTAVSTKPMSH